MGGGRVIYVRGKGEGQGKFVIGRGGNGGGERSSLVIK